MVVKGRTIGVIELLNKREGDFTEEDANRLMRMASTIGVALENARLFQQVATGRDRLEAILNSNNDGILMADMHDIVVTANPRAAQVFQTSQDDLLGRKLTDILTDLNNRAHDVSVPSWLNDDNTHTSEVVELELSGSQYIRQLLLPVRDTMGAMIGQLALLQDISKERELIQLRDDYTGMLVHDLRAPLTAIMNGIMMVRRGLGGSVTPQQDELLGIAYHSSQSMLNMVSTLLDISKMEQGRMPLRPEPFFVHEMAEETLDRLRASARGNEITLQLQVPDTFPQLNADQEKVGRVLQNLVDNAIKYSPSGGEVTVGVAWLHVNIHGKLVESNASQSPEGIPVTVPELGEGEWLLFWIRDQGPGIPPQYHERIFEKFGQVRGRKVRGTGLGLTFSRLAVESHGGKIWLESVEGEGTTFAFVLPLYMQYPTAE
jgi:PAS domain S-box-containing protein